MPRVKDLTGQRFGFLTVIEQQGINSQNRAMWLCKCDCGNEKLISSHDLHHHTKSCGCYQKVVTTQNLNKGRGWNKGTGKNKPAPQRQFLYKDLKNRRLKSIYYHMLNRCNNTENSRYKDYGGRGIKVCPEWADNLRSFYEWAINNGYSPELTLDRIDNNKGYFPDNCHWVNKKSQSNNTRRNIYITYNNQTKTVAEWADQLGIKYGTLKTRLVRGWSVERAMGDVQ